MSATRRARLAAGALLLGAFAAPVGAHAASVTFNAIRAVTVLEDRALVTRSVNLDVDASGTTVEIPALEAGIDPLSLDVSSADRSVTIVAVECDPASREPDGTASEEARAAHDQAEHLLERIEALEAERAALDEASTVLARYEHLVEGALANAASGVTPMDAAAWQSATRFLSDQRQALAVSTHTLEHDASELRDEWNLKLAAALRSGRAASRERGTRLRVTLAAERAGAVALSLRYAVNDAGWRPAYDARVAPSGRVTLARRALVAQRSGVDWVNVDLTLATRRADPDVRLPVLAPLRARFEERAEPETRVAASASEEADRGAGAALGSRALAAVVVDALPASDAPPPPPRPPSAPVSFHLAHPVTIPADGSARSLTLHEHDLDGEARLYAAPEQSALAYARLETTNPFDEPLLDGPLQVVGRAGLSARARIPARAPGEALTLFLGADDSVRITRVELEHGDTPEKVFLSGRKRLSFAYRLEAKNVGRERRGVTLAERIPVSEIAEIEVDLAPGEPAPTRTSRDGILEWDMDLAPGAARTIEVRYAVTVPSDFDWNAARP